jgi:hypothetical protein
MQTSYAPPSTSLTFKEVRTLALASLGGALEFYEFVIFVFFTAVIGRLFFSSSLPDWMRETQTFGIFAAGYLARPCLAIMSFPNHECCPGRRDCMSVANGAVEELFDK